MTTKLLFASRRAGLLGWHPRPRQTPTAVLPLFAALAAILLSASTPHLDASPTRSPASAKAGIRRHC